MREIEFLIPATQQQTNNKTGMMKFTRASGVKKEQLALSFIRLLSDGKVAQEVRLNIDRGLVVVDDCPSETTILGNAGHPCNNKALRYGKICQLQMLLRRPMMGL